MCSYNMYDELRYNMDCMRYACELWLWYVMNNGMSIAALYQL